jgi:hypothetical protein
MNLTIVFANCFIAAATLVIAWYAWQSHKLAKKIDEGGEEYRQQVAMLFRAIATSNLLSGEDPVGSTALEGKVKVFNKWNQDGITLTAPAI